VKFICGCTSLVDLSVAPASILRRIEESAFMGCSWPELICIPSSAIDIGKSCFSQCFALEATSFASSLILGQIEEHRFSQSDSLKSIAIPVSVRRLCTRTIASCLSLSDLRFLPVSPFIEIAGESVHDRLALESICIPASVHALTGTSNQISGHSFSRSELQHHLKLLDNIRSSSVPIPGNETTIIECRIQNAE
jgi:hypothetical protein